MKLLTPRALLSFNTTREAAPAQRNADGMDTREDQTHLCFIITVK